jgi:Icc-related predicted phosphoesterase
MRQVLHSEGSNMHPRKKILLLHSPPTGQLDLDKGKHKSEDVVNELIKDIKPEIFSADMLIRHRVKNK